MGSVAHLPDPKPRDVTVNPNLTSADNVRVGAGTGCIHLNFKDKPQRDAFASGLAMHTRHDTPGETTIRIFYSNNR